ncbi:MAG: hypothetical protein EXR39_03920 [Betaproteobacteria bacterium]|nr:hypothetical protein [Betaproteobacteria bacterium]
MVNQRGAHCSDDSGRREERRAVTGYCPAAVNFRDLPKTSTGKVQKFIPKEKEWAGLGKGVN